ncbi:putative leucine-rich repeat receptor-like serine/threonine-protein kinase [Heracleum sosnowskyi]|uniref:Leucine-rich repeat receptor-like serine/threonine-protein kinase n=1 Tax=Heracleum sosnowskyi TaxID=360622 RepID=A0AAD8HPQ1_9APIA|nr:putative leucine-rich repeat receptor-like serine/threonine-protein kinase [Heracleum sosnowskyi]
MALRYPTILFIILIVSSTLFSSLFAASVVEDLNNLKPPPDFNLTIANNCQLNPSLRYCNATPNDLHAIFKSTIVASHLCRESRNPNCVDSFPKINLRDRPKIAPLYLSFSFFWKYCPLTIVVIDISHNDLKGEFPSDVFHCTQIRKLDLSHNELSGDVPIQSFSLLNNLTMLNLSYNYFSETKISDDQFLKRFNSSSFIHSGLLPDHKKLKIKVVLLVLCFPLLVILLVGFLSWLCFWRPDFLPRGVRRKHKFTPSMLKAETDGFSKSNLVRRSAGTDIYKGVLRDGSKVRIEIYKTSACRENRRKFVEECRVLIELCHENLVQVLGWCDNRSLKAVVTEWVDEYNVEIWLSTTAPQWKYRVRILMGIIEGMTYLQEGWPEVDYDLKTSSILFSQNEEPMISRFRVDEHYSCSRKMYKFGVLVLEMITNRRPREEFEGKEGSFVEWVRDHYPEDSEEVIDEKLKRAGHDFDHATEALELGLMCTDLVHGQQPSLDEVYDVISRLHRCCVATTSSIHRSGH